MSNPPRRSRSRLVPAVLAAGALVLGLHLEFTVRRTDRARVGFDSAEYALAGREWARSGRLGTTFILPKEARAGGRPPFPLILGHPMVPALDALAFRFTGPGSAATLVPPAIAYLALVAAALGLARGLGASPTGAVVAAGAVAVARPVLYFASEGLTEIPFAALLTGIILMLARDRPANPAIFGALLGLAHLTRPVMAPLVPVALLGLLARGPRAARLRPVALALATFAPFAAGLALYKWAVTGDPLADVARFNLLVGLAPRFTPTAIQCMVDPPAPLPWMLANAGAVGRKLTVAVADLGPGLFAQGGLLGAVAAAALVAGLAGRRERVPAGVILGLAAGLVAMAALSLPSRRYLMPLLPALITVAVVGIERAARAARLPALVCVGLPALIAVLTLGRETARDWRWAIERGVRDRGAFSESEWSAAGEQLAAHVTPGTLMATDAGAILAWYADRPAVLIPERPSDLAVLGRRVGIGAVVLTNEWLLEQPGFEEWRAVAGSPDRLPGWRHTGTVRSGRLRAVVLRPAPGGTPPR